MTLEFHGEWGSSHVVVSSPNPGTMPQMAEKVGKTVRKTPRPSQGLSNLDRFIRVILIFQVLLAVEKLQSFSLPCMPPFCPEMLVAWLSTNPEKGKLTGQAPASPSCGPWDSRPSMSSGAIFLNLAGRCMLCCFTSPARIQTPASLSFYEVLASAP